MTGPCKIGAWNERNQWFGIWGQSSWCSQVFDLSGVRPFFWGPVILYCPLLVWRSMLGTPCWSMLALFLFSHFCACQPCFSSQSWSYRLRCGTIQAPCWCSTSLHCSNRLCVLSCMANKFASCMELGWVELGCKMYGNLLVPCLLRLVNMIGTTTDGSPGLIWRSDGIRPLLFHSLKDGRLRQKWLLYTQSRIPSMLTEQQWSLNLIL